MATTTHFAPSFQFETTEEGNGFLVRDTATGTIYGTYPNIEDAERLRIELQEEMNERMNELNHEETIAFA